MRFVLMAILTLSIALQGCVPTTTTQGDKALAPKDYLKAVEHYDKVLRDAIEKEQTAIAFRKETEAKFSHARTELVTDYLKRASILASNNAKSSAVAVGDAINLLEKIEQWDDKTSRLVKQLALYKKEKNKLDNALSLIEKQFGEYNFSKALATIVPLLKERPNNKELQTKKESATKLNSIYKTFQNQLKKGDLKEAHTTGKLLAKALPADMDFNKSAAKADLMKAIRAKADSLTQKNKFSAAVTFLNQFNLPELEGQIAQIKSSGSNAYYIRALKEDKAGNSFLSYLLIKKALTFQEKTSTSKAKETAIFNLQQKTSDYIDKSLQEYIAIASFDSPAHDPDAGMQFADSLTSYLYNVLPYGINILERDKIDFIMKEKKQGNNIGKVLGANLVITGRVSLFKIETSEDRRNATAKVITDEQVVTNPTYTQMLAQYGSNTKTWPSVPPATIVNKTHQMITYGKGTARLKGFAKVSIRIFDTSKAAISFVKDYPANIEDVSEFQDEVKEANIPYIPKKLISSVEAKTAMREKIVQEIGKVVQSSFDQRERRFLNLANHLLERREQQRAIEPLAKGYHYCLQENIPGDNKTFIEIQRLVDSILDQ